jgi:soluble lytic murein transglycosylase
VLGISSYNAGPGRTREWISEFGDPRKGDVDPLDWIERIPIEETRRYVVKVLSNIQIYRARLGDEATALRLEQDLSRAREASVTPERRIKLKGTDTATTGN